MKNIAIYTERSTTTWKEETKIKTNFRTPMWDTYKEFIMMHLHDNKLIVSPNDLTLHSVKIYILGDYEEGSIMNPDIEFTLLKNDSNNWNYRYVEIKGPRFQQWLESKKFSLL